MDKQDTGFLQVQQDKLIVAVSKSPVTSIIVEEFDVGFTYRELFNKFTGLGEPHTKIFQDQEEVSDWDTVATSGNIAIVQIPAWEGVVIAAIVSAIVGAAIGYLLYEEPEVTSENEKQRRVQGDKNANKGYEPLPYILGKRKIVPAYAALPYTEWVGQQQYYYMLLHLGYGPLKIEQVKIGEVDISNFDRDTEVAWVDWYQNTDINKIKNIWSKSVVQTTLNEELPRINNFLTSNIPVGRGNIKVVYNYPQGLRWQAGRGPVTTSSSIQFQYMGSDGQWYTPCYYSNYNGVKTFAPYNRLIKGADGYGWIIAGNKHPRDYNLNFLKRGFFTGDELDPSAFNNIPNSDVVYDNGNGFAIVRGNHRLASVSNVENTGSQFTRTFEFNPELAGSPYSNKPIAFRARNLQPENTSEKPSLDRVDIYTVTRSAPVSNTDFNSLIGLPKNGDNENVRQCILALKIRASEQLTGTVDDLNVVATSVVPSDFNKDWRYWYTDSSQRTNLKPSNNPADMYKWVLQGPMNPSRVSLDRIDVPTLSTWRNRCNSDGWQTSALMNEASTLKDVLSNIAKTGRAQYSFREKFSVVENIKRTTPVQIFTQKNSWGFSSRRDFPPKSDGVTIEFQNENEDFEVDEWTYYHPEIPEHLRVGETDHIEMWGVAKPTLIQKHARFAFLEKLLRREVYQISVDIEGLACERGSLVRISNDIIDVGIGSGYIKSVSGNSFVLDETIGLVVGQTYGVSVRSISSGININTFAAEYVGGGEFVAPSWSGSLEVGQLVSYGELGNETLDCIVQEIQYNANYEATLTLVNAANEIYDYDGGYLPPYTTAVTPRPEKYPPVAPTVVASAGESKYDSPTIKVTVSTPQGQIGDVIGYRLQYRIEDEYWIPFTDDDSETSEDWPIEVPEDATVWRDAGYVSASDGVFHVPVSDGIGVKYFFRAKAYGSGNLTSAWSDTVESVISDAPAPDVLGFTIEEEVNKPKTPDSVYSTLTITVEAPETGVYRSAIVEYRTPDQDPFDPNHPWYRIAEVGWENDNSASVQVFSDGRQYEIRVRSVSVYGVANRTGLSKIFTTTNTSDPEYTEDNPFEELPAPNVRGLELFDQGNDTEFTGRDAKFTWRKSTLNDWVDLGYEGLKGASNAVLDQYFRDYEVEIIANDEVVRVENVVDNIYTYTYEKNAEDYERRYGVAGAYREFRISVIMRTRQNQESEKPAVLDVANPAPEPLTGIELIPGFRNITVSYNRPTDLDYQGVEVWVGNTSGFDINDDTLVYDGPDTEVVIGGLETDTQYYIILRPYDAFGKVDIFSTELTATTLKIATTDLDNTKPDTVTNVAATTDVYDSRLQSTSYIDVTWDAVTNTRIANYTLDINGESQYTVAGTSFRFTDAIPGEDYTFKVRANSFASIEGDFSAPVTISAAVSSVAPAVITNASVSGGLEKVVIEWTNPNSENFYSVGIYRGTTAGFTPSEANKIASVVGSIGSVQRSIDTDVVNGTTYYYKLIPETLGGVQGSVVNAGSATPFKISSANVSAYFESAAIDQAYIGDLDANKITTGTLDAERIGADTITSDKIDVATLDAITANMGTLTAGKISIGNTTTGLELDTLNGVRAFNTGTQTLHFKPDGTGYIGASQDISWDGSGNVSVSGELGAGSIFTNGQIKSVNGGVEVVVGPKDFGNDTYLLSGTNSSGGLVFGVDENGGATFAGKVTITGGSSGISNFSDAGSLATKSSVDDTDVTFNYAASTSKGGNATDTDNVAGESALTVKNNASSGATFTSSDAGGLAYKSTVDWSTEVVGAGKPENGATVGADWNSTLSNIPNRIKDTATLGLNLTETYMGYYDGTDFRSYIQSNGSFHFGSSADNFIDYNGSKLAINTDNFTVDPQGNATFSGSLDAASGTFKGQLQAATGVLGNPSGNRVEYDGTNLIINTPEFSVDSAGNASFSGTLAANTISTENIIVGSVSGFDKQSGGDSLTTSADWQYPGDSAVVEVNQGCTVLVLCRLGGFISGPTRATHNMQIRVTGHGISLTRTIQLNAANNYEAFDVLFDMCQVTTTSPTVSYSASVRCTDLNGATLWARLGNIVASVSKV